MKAMREHEWLDPRIHELRVTELKLVGEWVAAGIAQPADLVTMARELLDMRLTVAALVPETELPGLLPATKKRPRPDDGTRAEKVVEDEKKEKEKKAKKARKE